ncbi:hypothetical protein EVAR_19341_1 [Eumeta japonica]|uniref:Uncharacterized protein n=1 Tax=Eumeta variegata TaxID=151549 RepID=A0A4C1TRC2_EUMVA|nr:hypothetical protein EVAR_19341_1 [Eumeta japonica]
MSVSINRRGRLSRRPGPCVQLHKDYVLLAQIRSSVNALSSYYNPYVWAPIRPWKQCTPNYLIPDLDPNPRKRGGTFTGPKPQRRGPAPQFRCGFPAAFTLVRSSCVRMASRVEGSHRYADFGDEAITRLRRVPSAPGSFPQTRSHNRSGFSQDRAGDRGGPV